ncbi:MAG: transglycosylase domain-containing protein [Bacteroidales bacterium]|nr:transglycosylase domain-containing protein [Bacteroidales bacterium]
MSKKKPGNFKKYLKVFWIIVFLPLVLALLIFGTISLGLWGFMPSFEELENPKSNLASEIYSADGELLGTFYIHNRSNIEYDDLSPNLVKALLATEDIRFHNHSGVDVRSVMRVIFRNIIGGQRSAGGGSTLTQQLAKNLFPRQESPSTLQLVIIKLKEWVTAARLERNYTKDEIIAMYLNTVDFGSHAFGIKSAAKTYFNTSPDSLRTEESALLVGLLQAPSWYHPVRNTERSLQRRNVVLSQMTRYGYITPQEFDSLRATPVDMTRFSIQDQNTGPATYFREYLRNELTEWSKTRVKPDGENYNIYKDGLKIYTTIDSRMQRHAEAAVAEHMGGYLQKEFFDHWKGFPNAPFGADLSSEEVQQLMNNSMRRSDRYRYLQRIGMPEDSIRLNFNTLARMRIFTWEGEKDTIMTPMDSIRYYKHFLNTGLMAVEPQTGFVKAYVGGIDFKHFKFDHVTQSKRQVGSTFKPFLYTLAMREGEFGPCSKVPNIPVSFELWDGTVWTPKNSSDRREGEMVTLKWALANSVNYISAFLIKRYSPHALIDLVERLGITSPLDPVPAIALGTPDISVNEMVGAMATFANKGVHIQPRFITHIEDNNGNLVESFNVVQNEAMNERTAYLMLELMKGVVESGTGIRLRLRYGLNNPIAGKTGTTQNNSDGWFIGLTPDLAAGVWVGAEDRGIRFRTITLGQGANMALPIWAKFMTRLYEDESINISQGDFEPPLSPMNIVTDCDRFEDEEPPQRDIFDQSIF